MRLPIFVRPTKRGAYWYCHVKLPSGKRKQRALHIRADGSKESERAAIAAYWREQARATNGELDRPKRQAITLGEALKALSRQQALEQLTEHRLRSVRVISEHLLDHFEADFDLTTIVKTIDLVDYATQAIAGDEVKKRRKRAPVTVRMEMMVLAQAMRAVGLNPPKLPKLGGTKAKAQEPLNPEQLRKFMLALKPKHKLVGLTFACLGIRASEFNKIGEVNWDARMLHVVGTKTEDSDRWMPIPDELFEMMETLRQRGEWKGFGGVGERQVDNIIRKTCIRIGIGPRSSNDLRGTFSTNLAMAGVSAAERAALQGNSELMQVATYSQPHLRAEELRGATDKLPRINRHQKSPCSSSAPTAAETGGSTAGAAGCDSAK